MLISQYGDIKFSQHLSVWIIDCVKGNVYFANSELEDVGTYNQNQVKEFMDGSYRFQHHIFFNDFDLAKSKAINIKDLDNFLS